MNLTLNHTQTQTHTHTHTLIHTQENKNQKKNRKPQAFTHAPVLAETPRYERLKTRERVHCGERKAKT